MSRRFKNRPMVVAMGVLVLMAAGLNAQEAVDWTLPENGGLTPPELKPWSPAAGSDSRAYLIDDFNRADGPLGPEWIVQAGDFQIVSQTARGSNVGLATYYMDFGMEYAQIDVAATGTALQYAAVVLNYGGGTTNLFVKVQVNSGAGFDYGGCYIGNNNGSGSFGLGFFALDEAFDSATMAVEVDPSRTVTIDLTNVNGGALADQHYVCTGAPPAEGGVYGMGGYAGLAAIDNFSDNFIPVELQRFTVE